MFTSIRVQIVEMSGAAYSQTGHTFEDFKLDFRNNLADNEVVQGLFTFYRPQKIVIISLLQNQKYVRLPPMRVRKLHQSDACIYN